ncbi:MAG: hypothetical protein ABJN84_08560 [Flavobacteriaceae bacterium]
MQNLESLGVQELQLHEAKQVQGGIFGFFLGFMAGMLIMDLIFGK